MKKTLSRMNMNYGEKVSLKGYLNPDEFMKTLSKALKQSTLAGFAAYAALTILGDFESWYLGPYKAEAATLIALVLGFLRARQIGAQYFEKGADSDES
jgi:hypothetical protein